MRSRRTLGVDVELAEELKKIAKSRGMSLASYLRMLFEEVINTEKSGHFAPGVLREKRAELVLSKLGFSYLPLELLDTQTLTPEYAEALGMKLAAVISELGISCEEVIEKISLSSGIGVLQEDAVILIPTSGPKEILRRFLIGLARGSSLRVSTTGSLVVVRSSR
ncbi:MAG: hypothetical protein RMI56_00350 [Sulfolobales archaeon]|nr:hypothetical protein [Sulfolobales archaeon]MDW8082230.1 hypothetical protein [Sulfolobales archaeon]